MGIGVTKCFAKWPEDRQTLNTDIWENVSPEARISTATPLVILSLCIWEVKNLSDWGYTAGAWGWSDNISAGVRLMEWR